MGKNNKLNFFKNIIVLEYFENVTSLYRTLNMLLMLYNCLKILKKNNTLKLVIL